MKGPLGSCAATGVTTTCQSAGSEPEVLVQGMTKADFKDIMAVDKKVLDGKLRLILLKGALGSCVVTGDFDPAALEATLDAFAQS